MALPTANFPAALLGDDMETRSWDGEHLLGDYYGRDGEEEVCRGTLPATRASSSFQHSLLGLPFELDGVMGKCTVDPVHTEKKDEGDFSVACAVQERARCARWRMEAFPRQSSLAVSLASVRSPSSVAAAVLKAFDSSLASADRGFALGCCVTKALDDNRLGFEIESADSCGRIVRAQVHIFEDRAESVAWLRMDRLSGCPRSLVPLMQTAARALERLAQAPLLAGQHFLAVEAPAPVVSSDPLAPPQLFRACPAAVQCTSTPPPEVTRNLCISQTPLLQCADEDLQAEALTSLAAMAVSSCSAPIDVAEHLSTMVPALHAFLAGGSRPANVRSGDALCALAAAVAAVARATSPVASAAEQRGVEQVREVLLAFTSAFALLAAHLSLASAPPLLAAVVDSALTDLARHATSPPASPLLR